MTARRPALAVVAALALALAGCGDDDESLVTAAEGPYTVTLPEAWIEPEEDLKRRMAQDIGARVESEAGREIDIPGVTLTSFWSRGEPGPDSPNAIVIREPVPEDVTRQQFVDVSIANAEQLFKQRILSGPDEVTGLEVAGEPAPAFDYEIELEQTAAKRTLFAFRGDSAYTLTLTSRPEDFEAAAADLDEILASWTWAE